MKARLSFVVNAATTRRPSAKPEPTSPRNKDSSPGLSGEDEGPPMPEPLTGPPEPRPSVLNVKEVQGNKPEDAASPKQSKTRSKSVLELKNRASDLSSVATTDASGGMSSSDDESSPKQVFPSSVREGLLKKKGVINVSWKKRYIVLLPHQLAYYDEQPKTEDAVPKGFINLGSILKCEHHDKESSLKDFTFDVVTPTRIFRLQADSLADMDAWIASISGTAANEQQIIASRKRNVSHAAIRTLTEQERLKVDDSAKISHQDAELRNWPQWNAFEVAAWLQTFGLARYSQSFYNAGITGEKFKTLDDGTLSKVCEVEEKSDRVKILAQIKKLMADTKRM